MTAPIWTEQSNAALDELFRVAQQVLARVSAMRPHLQAAGDQVAASTRDLPPAVQEIVVNRFVHEVMVAISSLRNLDPDLVHAAFRDTVNRAVTLT